ncbi:verprolin-like [Cynara cardunculus var. scolymus]|uniref:verprolin-like n=1 Tax=Cynara cardunculus var. scolymus TaxID=59895 RepID=UPI000D627482|nr:verprolin-like [Cynara cardunculus var. scolymus]
MNNTTTSTHYHRLLSFFQPPPPPLPPPSSAINTVVYPTPNCSTHPFMAEPTPPPPPLSQPSPSPPPPSPLPSTDDPSSNSDRSRIPQTNPSKIPIRPQKIRKLSSFASVDCATTLPEEIKRQSTIAEADASKAIILSTTTTTVVTKNRHLSSRFQSRSKTPQAPDLDLFFFLSISQERHLDFTLGLLPLDLSENPRQEA